jgi:hypothetical protein
MAMLDHCLLRRPAFAPFQAAQESFGGGSVPFAVPRRWYLSLVQLTCNGVGGDKASSPEFPNCRSQGLGSHVCRLLVRQSIIDPAICSKAKARKHPRHGGAMPLAAKGGRCPSSVQFICQRNLGHEPSRHKLPNCRGQSMRVGVRGPLIGQRTMTSAHARRAFPAYLLH